MKNNSNMMKKLMFFSLFLMIFNWVSLGLSFESWEGNIVNAVSLREAPSFDQKVLMNLKPGVAVTIIDKNGDWCRVIAKEEQPQQKGLILRKLCVTKLFTHDSPKQSELKGWVSEKDINRVAEKPEVRVAAPVKEEKIKPEASVAEKANVNQETQKVKAIPPNTPEAKITEPLANAEQ
jgi:hypothetical protein